MLLQRLFVSTPNLSHLLDCCVIVVLISLTQSSDLPPQALDACKRSLEASVTRANSLEAQLVEVIDELSHASEVRESEGEAPCENGKSEESQRGMRLRKRDGAG